MARTNITLNILSGNEITTHLKFINTITQVLTSIMLIVAIVFYFQDKKEKGKCC